jgi:hypothetical protein
LDDASAGSDPVPLDHDNPDDLRQARVSALARLQLACSPLQRASLEQKVAALDERLASQAESSTPRNAP